jgi:hypothetical protein
MEKVDIKFVFTVIFIIIEFLFIVIREFQWHKEKTKFKKRYNSLFESIINGRVNKVKHIDIEFIEDSISRMSKLGDRLVKKNISKQDIQTVKDLIHKNKIKLFEYLLFSENPDDVKKSLGFLANIKEPYVKDLVLILIENIKENNGNDWNEIRHLSKSLFKI